MARFMCVLAKETVRKGANVQSLVFVHEYIHEQLNFDCDTFIYYKLYKKYLAVIYTRHITAELMGLRK